jgi:long-subunit acyl-CoA synthetase (AMP-forming)
MNKNNSLILGKNPDEILQNASELIGNINNISKDNAIEFLDYTNRPEFLLKLSSDNKRNEWADLCYEIIRKFNYKLSDMIESRSKELPDRVLFHDMTESSPGKWTYKRISQYLKQLAASFYEVAEYKPKVAIFCDNSVVSACCDLACLSYDIFITPLNISFNREILIYIIETLDINIIITDDKSRIDMILGIKNKLGKDIKIFASTPNFYEYSDEIYFLGDYETKFTLHNTDEILSKRQILDVNQICTVMFTSGSTGMPKGLSFSMYNLITKRFARGAAVPEIGKDEVLLCYLPLYHTFGRFLELMGSIYWRGTYTLVGNTSSDTILNLFPKIEPSVFISIPLRWNQLYDKAQELMSEVNDTNEIAKIFREVVGGKLKWGLSAAGYLAPKVFTFFSKNNVELCSGFGMTEATGGITMTPPYNYKVGTVGKPLPGVKTVINSEDVLEISGHYVARYLDNAPPYSHIPYPDEEDFYISTGDVFRCDKDGFYEIIDRVKDIYKNNKGQTISPKNVEIKFEGVPGIKRTFLVGDGKPYNSLFIIPDCDEDIIMSKPEEEIHDYLHKIIMKANSELVPYERVINYMLLKRDFSLEKGELTPKNSYNRKNIEKNFQNEIEQLYEKNHIDITFDKFIIRIPRWFYRDLGILETDIKFDINSGLVNSRENKILKIATTDDENQIKIGDMIYEISSKYINLGVFSRQPLLWAGNPNLINFCPIKEGWDTNFDGISENVFIPYNPNSNEYPIKELNSGIKISTNLIELNSYFCDTIYGSNEVSIEILFKLEKLLEISNERLVNLIRKRIQTLARHPNEEIRAEAYRILLLDEPSPDYSKAFPAFVKSGLTYLNENSINKIASGNLEIRRLEALRKRLLAYRTVIELPNTEVTIRQFTNLFKLLYDFLLNNPDYYTSIRYELISWMLFDKIPELSKVAEEYFHKIHVFYENMLDESTIKYPYELWASKIIFDDGISNYEISLINSIIINKAFLKQSIILCYDEDIFSINDVKERGAWISRLNSGNVNLHYRIVIVMKNNRRYDLQFFINRESDENEILNTILRHVAISGYPYGYRVVPKLGAYRQELRAWSFEYFGELSLWAKIREFSSQRIAGKEFNKIDSLRKFYIQGMSAFFTGWRNSGEQIIPGIVSPNNVIIPELDYRDGAIINSINGWKKYTQAALFIEDFIRNFYEKPTMHYPWLEPILKFNWIFDSCLEALGIDEAKVFFNNLNEELNNYERFEHLKTFNDELINYLENIEKNFQPQLKLISAIDRYNDWIEINPEATVEAKEQTIRELFSLYNLNIQSEPERFYLYLFSYFKDANSEIKTNLTDIINRLYRNKSERATQLIEISELQSLLTDNDDRLIFARMLFPRGKTSEMKIIQTGNYQFAGNIISSFIKDNTGEIYTFREVKGPSEVGNLYRIFFKEKYPKVISELDEFFVLTDSLDRIVGGICYRKIDATSVLIDGSIVITSLINRGLGTAMLEDFCSRMSSYGFESVKAHFFLKNFYLKRGFTIDKRHGTLVRFLNSPTSLIKGNYCIV